jgi:crotonobetainyl-CoA:carnitine CoA-transferase CaiB-like acyl-CoA transferase
VYLSISGFGTAEGAWLPGYDLIVQAVSGLMSLTGDPDGEAFRAGISVFDVMAGLHGLIGVLAALHQRDESGHGQHVEVNLMSSAMSGLVNQTAAYTAAGVVPTRMGNAHPSLFPYETMPTADRDMIITAGTTGSSGRSARCSGSPRWPTTRGSGPTATARRTGRSCGRCCWRRWPSGRRTTSSSR